MNSLGIKAGTTGGTLLVLVLNITGEDLLPTAVLAALGAVISYLVSWLMKRMLSHRR